MHVALAPMAYAIWLAFENLLVLISPKLHSKRLITYTNCCKKVIFTNFILNEWSACALNQITVTQAKPLKFAYCMSKNWFNVPKYWVPIITLTLCNFIGP